MVSAVPETEAATGALNPSADRAKADNKADKQSFGEMYEDSLKQIQEGEVIRGRIVQVTKEHVMVDIGYKSEGRIRAEEFMDAEGNVTAQVGDVIDVLLERCEDEEGDIILSKDKATKMRVWDTVSRAYNENGTLDGRITSRVKGGFSVDIGIAAFLPGSQVDLRPVKNFDNLIGQVFAFKVLKFSRRRGNVVLSRRAILESERNSLKENTLNVLEEGQIVEGLIKNITDYGVFVDLGGLDGLLHITDMSWGRVRHPSEMFNVADQIRAKVLKFDREKERVSLGLKQLEDDPWLTAADRFKVADRVAGQVVNLADYGAFVELEKGIEGLIHTSEMSWTRKVRHPSKLVQVGDLVECVVLNVDPQAKRISLGMKQIAPNPWDVIGERYPVGTTIEGKIKNITDFGLFIGIDEGIDGLVHISDISWTKRIKHPSELFKKGQEVQAIVLNIDRENERFSLGIKQLLIDPWEEVGQKYRVGAKITGTVTSVTDFGIFVGLEEGVEGLVHVSEVSREKIKTPVGKYDVGDQVSAKIVNINRKDRKIGLSIKKLEEEADHAAYADYSSRRNFATSNLGDLLRDKLDLRQESTEAAATTEPAEVTTEPAEDTTEPVEVTTEPVEVTTEPAEATTELAEVTTDKQED
ncbi:MAG: 30S ribosomal protein S1 [Pseudomonadota bacterium]